MKKIAILVLAAGLVFLNACNKSDDEEKDTTKPVITLTSPNSDDEFLSGQKINIVATFTDNKELSQYKIEIHDDFDGHTHLKTGSPAFAYSTVVGISGTSNTINLAVDIPQDVAAGPYHLIINALDKAGNEAAFAEADIIIKSSLDSIAPTLMVASTPSPSGGEIHLHGGSKSITLVCTAGDNESLKSYEVKLINKTTKVNYVDKDGNISGTSTSFNETVTFEDAWPDGDYLLVVEVFDLKNNKKEVEFEVHREK